MSARTFLPRFFPQIALDHSPRPQAQLGAAADCNAACHTMLQDRISCDSAQFGLLGVPCTSPESCTPEGLMEVPKT